MSFWKPVEDPGTRPLRSRVLDIGCVLFAFAVIPLDRVVRERMDDDPGWRLLDPGELLHVGSTLQVDSTAPFAPEPAHLLRVSDLDPASAASQHPQAAPS